MGKIKKTVVILAAIMLINIIPMRSAVAETNLLTNGDFNDYYTEGVFLTYYITDWAASDGISVNSDNLSDICFTAGSGNGMSITCDKGVVLEAKTYRMGVKVKSTGNADISFQLQGSDNYDVAGASIGNTNGEYREISATQSVDAGSYTFTIRLNSVEDLCYIDDVFLEAYTPAPEVNANLTTGTGAYIRLVENDPGLRFYGSVDKTYYDEFNLSHDDVSVGMIIVPKDYLNDCFSVYDLTAAGHNYLEIQAELWNNNPEADGFYGFNCAITGMHTLNLDRPFAARTYLKYRDGGVYKYIYGNFNETDNVRSIYEIANIAKDSVEYASLTQDKKDIVNYYAGAIEELSLKTSSYAGGTFTCTFDVDTAGYVLFSYGITGESEVVKTVARSGGEVKDILGNAFEVVAGEATITISFDNGGLWSPIENLVVKLYKNR